MEKIIIAAVAENRVIGKNGEMPWHIPKDMEHFKEKTTGNTVVMGRKTYQSLPSSYRPLPYRENIVLTRSGFKPRDESVKTANSLEEVWEKASNEKVFIAGGENVYRQALEKADKMILTEIKRKYDGDSFFPEFSKEEWKEEKREEHEKVDFVTYNSQLSQ